MAVPYLDINGFKLATIAPSEYVDFVETLTPGWTANRLLVNSGWLDSRLRKRYAAPFAAPYPDSVLDWLQRITTHQLYLKRGIDPNDAQMVDVRQASLDAAAEVKEAADAVGGLFDLPLAEGASDSDGITKAATLAYTEATPYAWQDVQLAAALDNDELIPGGISGL